MKDIFGYITHTKLFMFYFKRLNLPDRPRIDETTKQTSFPRKQPKLNSRKRKKNKFLSFHEAFHEVREIRDRSSRKRNKFDNLIRRGVIGKWPVKFLELVMEISIVHGFTGGARFHGVTLTPVSRISDGFTSFWPSLTRSRTKVTALGKRYTCWPRVCTWLSAKFRKTPPPTRGKSSYADR